MQAEPASVLIDRITYTASLVSRPEDIDVLLDPFREITARTNPKQPLNSNDRTRLLAIQKQLESYLVAHEHLRYYTPESLQLQIDQHVSGDTNSKTQVHLIIILIIALVSSSVLAILPPLDSVEQRILVGGATAFGILTVGAAWMFLTALPAFRSELRRAFLIICASVTLLGISMVEQAIIELFDLRHYPAVSVIYTSSILVAALLFHYGDILYARLVGVRNRWTSFKPLLAVGAPLALITWFIPHAPTNEPEIIHDAVAVICAIILLTPIFSAIILPMAKRQLPEIYKSSMTALAHAMWPIIAVTSYQYVLRVIAGPYMQGMAAYILFALVTCMALGLLRAGYTFNKVSQY